MHCIYQNVRGLNTKLNDFYIGCLAADVDLIAITETWCSPDVESSQLLDPDLYTIYRHDRNFDALGVARGGGCLLAVRNTLMSVRLNLSCVVDSVSRVDLVGCKIVSGGRSFVVLVLYMQSGACVGDYERLFECLERLGDLYGDRVLIMGDFNIGSYADFVDGVACGDSRCELLAGFLNFLDLKQLNTVRNSRNRMLDLILTNITDCSCCREDDPLVPEDGHHPTLHIDISMKGGLRTDVAFSRTTKKYNFRKANLPGLYAALLTIDWGFLSDCTDVDVACGLFYETLYHAFDAYVPHLRVPKRIFPDWYSYEIKRKLKRKNNAFRSFKRTGSPYYLGVYRRLRRELKDDVRRAYDVYLVDVQRSLTSDPGRFWSFVQKSRGESRLPSVLCLQDQVLDTPQNVVDGFASYFSSIFVRTDMQVPDCPDDDDEDTADLEVTESDVRAAVRRLKPVMTQGVDLVPSFLVRDCVDVLCKPLCVLFNLSIRTALFPKLWKSGRICPVYKKGDKSEIENYRPITILNNFAKVFETVIYGQLYSRVQECIVVNQHGFIPGRSTVTNLVQFTQFVSEKLDANTQVDTVYTDFSKAFDVIDHGIVVQKLRSVGIYGVFLRLLISYLEDRDLFVEYLGYRSEVFFATSGVPQGSNLGPLLFVIFINDICNSLTVESLLYADDLKIFFPIESTEDCLLLQQNLDILVNWCRNNKLDLNAHKCRVLSFTRKPVHIHYDYSLSGQELVRVTSFRDLGVSFDYKMNFMLHICETVKSAMKSLGFIIRSCRRFTEVNCLKTLYFSFVRSRMEYASVVWSPFYAVYSTMLERVQRRFAKFLAYKCDGAYPPYGVDHRSLLARFDLLPLDCRRRIASVSFGFKILNGTFNCTYLRTVLNSMLHSPSVPLRDHRLFYMPRARTNLMLGSPIYVMCRNFNSLRGEFPDVLSVPLCRVVNFIASRYYDLLVRPA